MAKIEVICTLCGEKSKNESMSPSCPICSTSLETHQKEIALKTTVCITSASGAGASAQKGTLFLTDKRIFWIIHSSKFYQGIIAGIISKLFSPPKEMKFSFWLNEIKAIEIAQLGPFKQLKITTVDGEAVALDIKTKHIQEWIDEINDAKKNFAS